MLIVNIITNLDLFSPSELDFTDFDGFIFYFKVCFALKYKKPECCINRPVMDTYFPYF